MTDQTKEFMNKDRIIALTNQLMFHDLLMDKSETTKEKLEKLTTPIKFATIMLVQMLNLFPHDEREAILEVIGKDILENCNRIAGQLGHLVTKTLPAGIKKRRK